MKPSELLDKCPLTPFRGSVYRAIYTSFPTRNLYSDIGFREGDPDFEIAMYLADIDASIDFSKTQQLRTFQYSDFDTFLKTYTSEVIPREDLLFPLMNAQKGRFSDGTYGVFYSALEEATSLAEVAFHFVEECLYDLRMAPDVFQSREVDKRIVQLQIDEPEVHDFRPFHGQAPELTDESLSFCQTLGSLLKSHRVPMALTPSARTESGTCAPIFLESALPREPARTLRFYHFRYDTASGLKVKRSDIQQTDWAIPGDWRLPLER